MPISFKGRLIQYAGRLHRVSQDKNSVLIYDYVESDHPLTAHMHRKRLVAYREMGYSVQKPDTELFTNNESRVQVGMTHT